MTSRWHLARAAVGLAFSVIALLLCVSVTSGHERLPVIGCDDFRYAFANRWSWRVAPGRLCKPGTALVGIDHARWRSWGAKRATATGSFVDGLGFEYSASITAFDLRTCAHCDGVRAPQAWYRRVRIVSAGGIRGGVMRGPFNLTLFVAPEQRIITLGDFVRHARSLRVQFVVGYMTSHADNICYGGKPTPVPVAMNVAGAIANYRPGFDPATGAVVSAAESIGRAIRSAEAEIGC
jgi:hypothetical protein